MRSDRIHDRAVVFRLCLEAGFVEVILVDRDIQLGDLNIQTGRAVLVQRACVDICARICVRTGSDIEVGLEADAVDQALCLEIRRHFDHGIQLAGRVLIEVVVIELGALRRILSCVGEGRLDEGIVAEDLDPCGAAVAVLVLAGLTRLAVVEICLIDNVPCVEVDIRIFLRQRRIDRLDVILHALEHGLLVAPLGRIAVIVGIVLHEEPCRRLAVPDENVAADGDLVVACEIEDRARIAAELDLRNGIVAGLLQIGLRCGLREQRIRLQLIAERDRIVVLENEILRGLRCQLGGGHGAADLEIIRINILQARNILLDRIDRRSGQRKIIYPHRCGISCFNIDRDILHFLREAELHGRDLDPCIVTVDAGKIVVVLLAVSIGELHTDARRVVPLHLDPCGCDVLDAGLAADRLQTDRRAVPAAGALTDRHTGLAGMRILGRGLNDGGILVAALREGGNIAVLKIRDEQITVCRADAGERHCLQSHHSTDDSGSRLLPFLHSYSP